MSTRVRRGYDTLRYMDPDEQRRLVQALGQALAWHGDQRRKGSTVPYISHLLAVSGFVLEHGGTADQGVAALLHDVVEDTAGTLVDVEASFGPVVASMVADCTDTRPGDTPKRKSPWFERKSRFLDRLPSVPADSALVIACDKRHNLASLVADVRAGGVAAIGTPRFSATPEQQLWYYREAISRLRPQLPERLAGELEALVAELEDLLRP